MKILHVNKFFDLHGGAEFYLHGLMAHQKAQGHEVHVFSTLSERNLPSEDAEYFVTRHAYNAFEGPWTDLKKAANFIWNRQAKQAFARQVADLKPDVIHLHNIYHHLSTSILSVVRRSGIRCVQTLHDYKLACPNYTMFTEGKTCERCKGGHYCQAIRHNCLKGFWPSALAATEMSLTKFDQSYERTVRSFICPSKFMQNKMRDWGEPPGKLVHVPNPTDWPEQVAADRDTGPYVYIGRLSQEKSVETLIRAAANLPEIELSIIGDGPERQRLERLAFELAPHGVRFLGFQSGEALARYRRQARAILLPTISYENSPLTVLEALAHGVPVIASNIGGIPELVRDGLSGFLVEPGNVDAWIDALKQMQDFSSAQRLGMGDAGRASIRQGHSWGDHLDKLQGIYLAKS